MSRTSGPVTVVAAGQRSHISGIAILALFHKPEPRWVLGLSLLAAVLFALCLLDACGIFVLERGIR